LASAPIVLEQKASSFKVMGEGLHKAKFSEIKDLGEITNQFGTKRTIAARLVNDAGEEATRFYTPSLHEKATLAKDLLAIFGKVPTKIEGGIDGLTKLLVGREVQILVTNSIDGKGRQKAKIEKLLKAAGAKPAVAPAPTPSTNTEITDNDLGF
jgi:hypothetical protein